MELKYKVIISIAVILVAFASGRYLTPEKVVTVTKTVEVEKKTKTQDKNKHYVVTKHEVDKPDGTKDITTTKTETDNTETKVADTIDITQDQTKTVTAGTQKVTLSALVGVQASGTPNLVYGAEVYKPILGPLGLGAFVLTDKTVGMAIGLSF